MDMPEKIWIASYGYHKVWVEDEPPRGWQNNPYIHQDIHLARIAELKDKLARANRVAFQAQEMMKEAAAQSSAREEAAFREGFYRGVSWPSMTHHTREELRADANIEWTAYQAQAQRDEGGAG